MSQLDHPQESERGVEIGIAIGIGIGIEIEIETGTGTAIERGTETEIHAVAEMNLGTLNGTIENRAMRALTTGAR